jgi:hypothetical protein
VGAAIVARNLALKCEAFGQRPRHTHLSSKTIERKYKLKNSRKCSEKEDTVATQARKNERSHCN